MQSVRQYVLKVARTRLDRSSHGRSNADSRQSSVGAFGDTICWFTVCRAPPCHICTGTGLDWTGLDWTGLDWAGMDCGSVLGPRPAHGSTSLAYSMSKSSFLPDGPRLRPDGDGSSGGVPATKASVVPSAGASRQEAPAESCVRGPARVRECPMASHCIR